MLRQFSDLAGAEDAIREAIRLNPGHAEAHHELSMLLLRRNRLPDAFREARLSVYLAPLTARFEQDSSMLPSSGVSPDRSLD